MLLKIKGVFSKKIVQNASCLGLAELANRFFRLGTTITLARIFSPHDYGLMAILFTAFEIANVFTLRGGLSAKIVQSSEVELEDICNTSYWLNWILCILVCIAQCVGAFIFSFFVDDKQIILALCAASLVYLMFPFFMVQAALIERNNRLEIRALCNALQSFLSNLITIVLALSGFGIWSIVVAMLLSTPIWIVVHLISSDWQYPRILSFRRSQSVFEFGKNILGSHLMSKLRNNLDYLIVGSSLGVDALGIYYFAFNAGSGITMNVTDTLMSSLYPQLCLKRDSMQSLKRCYFENLKLIFPFLILLVFLQTFLAPFYVPIVFGEKWTSAIPILMIICISVIPRAFKWSLSLLMNAADQTQQAFRFDIVYTLLFAIAVFIASNFSIIIVAITVFLLHLIMSYGFSWLVFKGALSRKTA